MSLMVLQFVSLFSLVLPKLPAISVIPALLSLVFLHGTRFVALVVSHGTLVIAVLPVGLSPLSMQPRAS